MLPEVAASIGKKAASAHVQNAHGPDPLLNISMGELCPSNMCRSKNAEGQKNAEGPKNTAAAVAMSVQLKFHSTDTGMQDGTVRRFRKYRVLKIRRPNSP